MSDPQPNTIGVIDGAQRAAAILHPIRMQILAALREPGSATTLAGRLRLPRQKVNYHLRELEKQALVELVEEKRRGNCTERVLRSTARYYVISPKTIGRLAADPGEIQDRFSAAYLTAVAGRTIDELGELRQRADKEGKRLPTLSIETEVRFASAAKRAAFANELADRVAALVAKYHDGNAQGGRRYRFFVGAHPKSGRKS